MKRRTFLIGSVAVVGGVAIGYFRAGRNDGNPLGPHLDAGQTALTPYVIIDHTGVTLIAPRAEMGQGIHTTLAALVAEELDVAMDDVKVIHGPASEAYSNTVAFGSPSAENKLRELLRSLAAGPTKPRSTQLTGGQSSIRDAFVKMRLAGAAARVVLVRAAAERLGVEPETLTTEKGAVVDRRGARLPYTELATLAAGFDPPQDPVLKPRSEWRRLGTSLPRVDMVSKCTGTAEFFIDTRLPGLLHATVRRTPRLGGIMRGYDASTAEKMPGVKRVIPLETGVVVIATNTWYAFEAAKAIEIDWGPAPYPDSSAAHRQSIREAKGGAYFKQWRNDGDVEGALAGTEPIQGDYWVPYLAHATMEPMNAVAVLKNGRLEIWAGTQYPTKAVLVGAEIAGVEPEAVEVHTTYMGGGFGRRLEMDFIKAAACAAREMEGIPVKVTWSREEDMTHDVYRPMATASFRAAVSDRRPVALDLKVASPSLRGSANIRNKDQRRGEGRFQTDKFIAAGAWEQPYRIENYRVTAYPSPPLLPVGWWRSVGESQNSFCHESIMDELAHAARVDPLEMRLSLLKHAPSRRVLEMVAEMSNWGSRLPAGHGRGVAYVLSSGAATAQVIEVKSTDAGIRVLKAYAAVDVGIALDPGNIVAQVQSGLIFGLSAAMMEEIRVAEGVVAQSNFDSYQILRIDQAPRIQVEIHESGSEIFGAGEAGTPAAAPALGNAIFAATGRRIRELPFGKAVRFL